MAQNRKAQASKAELVRQRRKQQDTKRKERKVQRAQPMPATQNTPIFVRRGVVGTPVVQRTRTNVKRKFVLPLQNGSEVAIPGLPILKPGWRLLSGFIALSLIVFLIMINFSDVLEVSAINLVGIQRNNASDVTNVLKLQGRAIYSIDPQIVLANIQESFPEFYDVQIDISFPAVITIEAKERQPVLAWQNETLTLWIDIDGNIFPARGVVDNIFTVQADTSPPRLKVPMTEEEIQMSTDPDEKEEVVKLKDGPVDPQLIQEILDLQSKMPVIANLSYRSGDGFGWHDSANDWNVYFGHRLDKLDQKILLYENIKDYAIKNGIKPDMISVAYIRAPFYRLEQ